MIPFGHHLSDADLPAGWRAIPLKHLTVELQRGAAPDYVDDSTLRVIGQPCVRRGHVDLSRARHTAEVADPRRQRGYLHDGDVLITSTGAGTLGRAALFTGDGGDYVVDGEVAYLRPKRDRVDPRYLAYVLGLEAADRYMNEVLAVGATKQTHLNREPLAALPVVVPPLEEQRRITEFLDGEVMRLDTTHRRVEEVISLIEERFRAFRWLMITGKLFHGDHLENSPYPWIGRFPRTWKMARLKHVCRSLDGRRVPLNAEERNGMSGPYPYFGANGVVDYVDHHLFDETTVLLGEDGAPFFDPTRDVAWVATGKYWVNNHAHVLAPLGLHHQYMCGILNITDYSAFIGGSTRDKLTQEAMWTIPVPVPPLTIQQLIVDRIEKERKGTRGLVLSLQEEMCLIAERRQSLITAAVTGQLDVTTASTTRTATTAVLTPEAVA